jgi:predicted tellurium resistance membrane protein TerC
MIIGLVISILFMTVFAKLISIAMERWPVIKWAGLGLLVYVAGGMLHESAPHMWDSAVHALGY